MPQVKQFLVMYCAIFKSRYFGFNRLYLGLCTMSLLNACSIGPDFSRPTALVSTHYIKEPLVANTADGKEQKFTVGATIPSEWWKLFKSSQLNAVVNQAIANNPTLQASEASLRQSQDNLLAGYGVFYPRVDVGASAYRARNAPLQNGLNTPSSIFNVVTSSGTISYILDVFGGERRAVEGLKAQSDYQNYMNKAAYVTLSANVVNACVAQVQFDNGNADYTSILSTRTLIASNQASLAQIRQRLSQVDHLLATLEGVEPFNVTLLDVELAEISLPLDLPLSLPSDLVRQRPDILAAESQLHVASANIGGAAGKFWSIGPGITLPLFRGGSLKYARQAAIDAFQVSQANYRQTVLNAFAQVADNLNALKNDADALQAQSDAKRTSKEALDLLQANYQGGLVAYVDVLIAEIQFNQATIAYFQAVAQRHQDTVGLFVALGGGWTSGGSTNQDEHVP